MDTLPTTPNPTLPFGYSPVAPGELAQVVTFLEMTERPRIETRPTAPLELQRFTERDLENYLTLFCEVGEAWLWSSRLEMAEGALCDMLASPQVEAYALRESGRNVGLLELDFRQAHTCELSFFGLIADAIGRGLGQRLMDEALVRAWAKPIRRLWVHTCTLDHPGALAFYRRHGFRPYAQMVEISRDPRTNGLMRRTAAPHIPISEP